MATSPLLSSKVIQTVSTVKLPEGGLRPGPKRPVVDPHAQVARVTRQANGVFVNPWPQYGDLI